MLSVTEFLNMGGQAPFVWLAYGIALVLVLAVAIASFRGLRQCEATLRKLRAAQGRRLSR